MHYLWSQKKKKTKTAQQHTNKTSWEVGIIPILLGKEIENWKTAYCHKDKQWNLNMCFPPSEKGVLPLNYRNAN